MAKLMLEGGYPMWFLALFSVVALLSAGRFAAAPGRRWLGITLSASVTALLGVLTGTAADLAAVGHHAPAYLLAHPGESLATVLLSGLAESASPSILGFASLSVVGLLVTLGLYRADGVELWG